MAATEYRPCVVAVFTNFEGKFLVCERSDVQGAWQFPQGGIEPGESALNALYREMREEIGSDAFKVVKEAASVVKYRFPPELKGSISQKWLRQRQTWVSTIFDEGAKPDLSIAEGEFTQYSWRTIDEVVKGIVDWKRHSYVEGLQSLGFTWIEV